MYNESMNGEINDTNLEEIEEAFDKAEELARPHDKRELPEAPVSITVRGYYKGFSVLITKRNATGEVELEKIIKAVDNMVDRGFKPSWNEDTNGKIQPKLIKEGLVCETCGGEAVEKSGETNNKKWKGIFCQNTECKKVKWLKA